MNFREESAPPSKMALPYSDLCRRIRDGDRAAEEALVRRLQPCLRVAAWHAAGGDLELTQELCQDTMVIILKRLRVKGLTDSSRLAEFAAQTARNLAIAHHRRLRRRGCRTDSGEIETIPDTSLEQLEQLSTSRLRSLVGRLMAELPADRDRAVLRRYYLQDEDKEDICRELNLSSLSFNQVLFRARNRFRAKLSTAGFRSEDL